MSNSLVIRQKMKPTFRNLLTIFLLLCCNIVYANRTYDFEVGGVYYNIIDIENNLVEVTNLSGSSIHPAEDLWMYGCYTGKVVIPTTVSCYGTIYKVTRIGDYAFAECSITSITIPNSVTSIGNRAFHDCNVLTNITIPESVKIIEFAAFDFCNSLKSLEIPNGVEELGEMAFKDCTSLTSITIPNSVTGIGEGAFSYCSGLTSITVNSGNSIYDSREGCNAIIETATNTLIAGCKNTIIPNSVTSIGEWAFWGCVELTSITIPNSVTSIDDNAFENCKNLEYITIENGNAIYDSRDNCNAIIETKTNTLITGCKNTFIPNSVTSIGNYAFDGCTGLTSIEIPNSVTSIGAWAFGYCSGLTGIELPNSVTSIGNYAFDGCTGLTSITIPNSVTSIGEGAFSYTNIIETTIPNSVTSIGSDAFASCKNLASVKIGDMIETIESSVFYNCSSLEKLVFGSGIKNIKDDFEYCENLKEIVCYATTPPNLTSSYVFDKKDLVVHIPLAVFDRYMKDSQWNRCNLLPFADKTIDVILPYYAADNRYKNMYIEVYNEIGERKYRYIITDKLKYSFSVEDRHEYNVYIKNDKNIILGSIEKIKKEDTEVYFTSLIEPKQTEIKVYTPKNEDVTSLVTITWTDKEGKYLSQQPILSGLIEEQELNYQITLSQDLAMQYQTPAVGKYTVKAGNNTIICKLEDIKPFILEGEVVDNTSNSPLSDITISASQTFAGKYCKIVNTKTNTKGTYKLQLLNTSTKITVAASDYISQTVDCDSLIARADSARLLNIKLKKISGVVLSLHFNYIQSVSVGIVADTANWYNDYDNIQYTIFNKTKNKNITSFNVQYPQIVLLEEVSDGDQLQITATSKSSAFKPVGSIATITDQKADLAFNIFEFGKIEAKIKKTANESNVAILYDAEGKFIKQYYYNNNSLTIGNVIDGKYTLVSMGDNQFFTTIYNLDQFAQTGLVANKDYVSQNIEVKSGVISNIEIESIPLFDESKFYYTGTGTSFTVNKTNIVSGNYLTLNGKIDFKEEYIGKVSNVNLIVDIPENCSFVENSVMVGNSIGNYILNSNRITIPLSRYTDRVRFCVIPTKGGTYSPSAFASFDIGGQNITQPIGSACYSVKNQSITLPSVFANKSIPISGLAQGKSKIEIFDNGVKIGETTSLANGMWAAKCELNEAYNLSRHNIYAKIETKEGLELETETKECVYDINAIQVSKVTMYHWNPELNRWEGEMQEAVFDFINPSTSATQWTLYYPNKKFTYTIEFTVNDPERISNVVLYIHTADGKFVPCNAEFDEKKGLWYTEIDMGKCYDGYYPVNCSVDFDYIEIFNKKNVKEQFIASNNIPGYQNIEVRENGSTENEINISIQGYETDISITTTIEELDVLPKKCEVDTIMDGLNIYKISDLKKGEVCYIFDKSQFESYTFNDEFASSSIKWLFAYKSNYVKISTKIVDNNNDNRCQSLFKAPSYGHIASTSFYANRTAFRFYQLDRTARERYQQLVELDNRINTLDCIPDDIRDSLRDLIDRLFQEYFDIKVTSTFMQSGRFNMTSPMYTISYAGGWLNFAVEAGFSIQRKKISTYIMSYENMCPPPPENGGGANQSGNPNDDVRIDPSGYVYEGVSSNRIQGVIATIYYKKMVEDMYGDLHENIVKWNAQEYAQENPLFTDKNGMYRWDVPQGLWQVKFEKEGYETTYSDWLPVPPPQLDVNIAMTQNKQPEVKGVKAYTDGVVVKFDKYMLPATLNNENIIVSQNGTNVEGVVEMLNEEMSYENETEKYASKVRFTPTTPFIAKEITLLVNNKVKSYTNITMQDNFQQTFEVEKEIKEIIVNDTISAPFGGSTEIIVTVLPAEAAQGKVLHATSASNMIASLGECDAVIEEDGTAQFVVIGELLGASPITFEITDVDVKASTYVEVVKAKNNLIEMPAASLNSGTSVYKGTEVTLTATSDEYKIWYTTDDSCPCDENGSRKLYNKPIIIEADVKIKAIAENSDGDASEIATFVYKIMQSTNGVVLNSGWNWVTFNMKNNELNNVNKTLQSGVWANGDEIKNNLYTDSYSNKQHKWLGTLSNNSKIENTGMYMIHSATAQTLNLIGEAINPQETAITVGPGWNYISYLPLSSLSVTEALSDYSAQEDDVIKSQGEFAIYSSDNGWQGNLKKLYPGEGYMLKRANNANSLTFHYPAINLKEISATKTKHYQYANNMNIVACVTGIELQEGDSIVAYTNNEIRGCSEVNENGNQFLTIMGDKNAEIGFSVLRQGEIIATSKQSLKYEPNTVLGNIEKPTEIKFISEDEIRLFRISQDVITDKLTIYINECNVKNFSVTIYNINGIVIKEYFETDIEEGEISISTTELPAGIYFVKVVINEKERIVKIVKK